MSKNLAYTIESMVSYVTKWGNINSYSYNKDGLKKMSVTLQDAFAHLNADETFITANSVKKSDIITLKKRPDLKNQCLFVGHYDTVHPPESDFQTVKTHGNYLIGPGVTDMKGGLAILLNSVLSFEKNTIGKKFGWTILLTPDEEIGSIGSKDILLNEAKKHSLGLIFEPPLEDGSFVSERMGSMNIGVTVSGKSAHAGRGAKEGDSAIHALCHWVTKSLIELSSDVSANVGRISGGIAPNIIADAATCSINIRSFSEKELDTAKNMLQANAKSFSKKAIQITLQEKSYRPPKINNKHSIALFKHLSDAAKKLNRTITYQSTGGVCDGNTLSSVGLPTIDTLGAMGKGLHTHNETLYIPSLEHQSLLTYTLLNTLNNSF